MNNDKVLFTTVLTLLLTYTIAESPRKPKECTVNQKLDNKRGNSRFLLYLRFKNNSLENRMDFFAAKLDLPVLGLIAVIREGNDINTIPIVS